MSALVYSRWRPDDGGYDYFQSTLRQNINDDLPAPELAPATKIGVPSIEAGRPVPAGAYPIGSGELAMGLVAPVDTARIVRRTRSLSGSDPMRVYKSPWFYIGGVGAVALMFWLVRDK